MFHRRNTPGAARRPGSLGRLALSAALALAALAHSGPAEARPPAAPPAAPVAPNGPGHQITLGQSSTSLDGAWRFRTDAGNTGESQGYAQSGYNDSAWDTLSVPGNWDVTDRYASYEGAAWYRRSFTGPALASGQVARLRFEAVYYTADVWLNGTYLGQHSGGYTPFEFDVTGLLQPGAANVIALRANNTYNVGAWYYWGGISRSVRLTVDPAVRIERQKIEAAPNLSAGTASLLTRVAVSNRGASAQSVQVTAQLTGADGAPLGVSLTPDVSGPLAVPAGATITATLRTTLAAGSYRLWQIDDPALYRVEAQLSAGGSPSYAVSDRFGIRKVELSGDGFYLNGERLRLTGFNRISDDRVNGNVEPTYLIRRDLDRMKAAGFTIGRIHHIPQAPALLDYADEKGILLITEIPVWGSYNLNLSTNPQPKIEMREMVERDWNHPSIIAWSVANEIAGATQAGRDFVSAMVSYTRGLDGTRLLTYASNTYNSASTGADEALQYTDFASMNTYGLFGGTSDKVRSLYPNKPVFVSEFSPDGYTFGTNRERLDFRTGADSAVRKYDRRPFVMGAAQWTYNDYRSTFGGTSINQARGWGVQDIWGGLKLAYDEMQAAYAPVGSLQVTPGGAAGGQRVSTLRLTPRAGAALEIPTMTLRGYRLIWQAAGPTGGILAGRAIDLPTIAPGGAALEYSVTWDDSAAAAVEERLTLLSPTGYEVAVARAALRAPAAPAIEQIVAASGALRVRFAPVPGAASYRVEATAGGTTLSATTERERFVDLSGLTNGTAYQVRVVAVNAAGSAASAAQAATPGGAALPPRLQALVPIQSGLVLGFIVNSGEGGWDVEVVDVATNAAALPIYRARSAGATRIEGLQAGRAYRVRLRGAGSAGTTAWSEWLTATTLGPSSAPAAPAVAGAIPGATAIGLRITPHPLAERYLLDVTPTGGATTRHTIEASAVDLIAVGGLSPSTTYSLALRVVTATGTSAASGLTARTAASNPSPSTPAADPFSATIFSDDFADGNATGWTAQSGSWSVPSGTQLLRQSSAAQAEALITAGQSAWADYRVEADIKLTALSIDGTNASATGLVARYRDANNYYLLRLHGGGTLQLYSKLGGTFTLLGETAFAAQLNQTYRLKLSVDGGTLVGSVEGGPSITRTNSDHAGGTVGARSYWQTADIDNVLVRARPTTLLSDDFADDDATGWTAQSGSWSVPSGAQLLRQSSAAQAEALITAGQSTWANYAVEADVRLTSIPSVQSATGVIARYRDANNYYLLRLHGGGTLQLYSKLNGTFTLLGEAPFAAQLNQTYRLKLTVQGSAVTGSVEGGPSIPRTNSDHASGAVGARSYWQTADIDNVLVR